MLLILRNLSAILGNVFLIKKIKQDKANSIANLKDISEAA